MIRVASLVLAMLAGAAQAQITDAQYLGETDAYPHAVLGDAIEYTKLKVVVEGQNGARTSRTFKLPDHMVFEDVTPRLWDVDGEPGPEVVTVVADFDKGAALAIFDENGFVAQTPHIGTRFRWLAPIGAADFDGDGNIEIGYIDRPHLAKTLRLWRFSGTGLQEVTTLKGLTNHRIGDAEIPGGVRDCGAGPEMVTANANWGSVMATRFDGTRLTTRAIAPYSTHEKLNAALTCK